MFLEKVKIFINKKTFSILRFIFCISFITIWVAWLISLPKESQLQKTKKLEKQKIIDALHKDLNQKSEILVDKTKKNINQQKNKEGKPQKLHVNEKELPTLANLPPVKQEEKSTNDRDEKKLEINNSININFSNIAGATKKVLLINMLQATESLQKDTSNEIPLRKEIHIEKKEYHPMIQKIKKGPSETITSQNNWQPKYIQEKKEFERNFENVSNNLDRIANQLELVGLIQNPNGIGAAIIRNKATNKIEILKKGEEYQELKLLEVKNNQIILGNDSLNKQYIKKIVSTK